MSKVPFAVTPEEVEIEPAFNNASVAPRLMVVVPV